MLHTSSASSPSNQSNTEQEFNIPVNIETDSNCLYAAVQFKKDPLPDPKSYYAMTLDEYRNLEEKDFAEDYEKKKQFYTQRVLCQLIHNQPSLWKFLRIKVPLLMWEELAMSLYHRTGVCMKVRCLRDIWNGIKNKLRRRLKRHIEKGDNDSKIEQSLHEWDLYKYIVFYRDITRKYEIETKKKYLGMDHNEADMDESQFDADIYVVKVVPGNPEYRPPMIIKRDPAAEEMEEILNNPDPAQHLIPHFDNPPNDSFSTVSQEAPNVLSSSNLPVSPNERPMMSQKNVPLLPQPVENDQMEKDPVESYQAENHPVERKPDVQRTLMGSSNWNADGGHEQFGPEFGAMDQSDSFVFDREEDPPTTSGLESTALADASLQTLDQVAMMVLAQPHVDSPTLIDSFITLMLGFESVDTNAVPNDVFWDQLQTIVERQSDEPMDHQ